MIKPWYMVPVLAAVALAGSAAWWHAKKDQWHAPAPRIPDLPQFEALPSPSSAVARQAFERPLFWASRKPADSGDKKTSLVQELMQSRLMAVFESGQERVAVLQRKDGSIFKIGAVSDPWKLQSFDGRKAYFVAADGQQAERPLEPGNPPATKARPARPQPSLANP